MRSPAPMNAGLQKRAIGKEDIIDCRPADLLKPEFEQLHQEIGHLANNDEDVLSYAMFPEVGKQFLEQRATGTLRIWAEPFTSLRVPKVFNLRSDPYERADITSNTYYDWQMSDGMAVILGGPPMVGEFFKTFTDYPPSQRAASFSIDQMAEALQRSMEAHAQ